MAHLQDRPQRPRSTSDQSQTYEGVATPIRGIDSISLMCDDIDAAKAGQEKKGATFAGLIEEKEFGRTAILNVPGADDIMLYEPRHPTAYRSLKGLA